MNTTVLMALGVGTPPQTAMAQANGGDVVVVAIKIALDVLGAGG